jgi:probable HAF family extracellular repeat protein
MFWKTTSRLNAPVRIHVALVSIAIFTLLGAPTVTTAEPPRYRVVEFDAVEGEYEFTADRINNDGTVIGRYRRGDEIGFTFRPAILAGGVYRTLPEGFQTTVIAMTAINDNGIIVGWEEASLPWGQAFATNGRRVRNLGTLGGHFSYALGISNNRTIVGYSVQPPPNDEFYDAFIWSRGEMTALPRLSEGFSQAVAVSDSKTAVGWSWDKSWNQRAVFWPAGGAAPILLTPGVDRGFPETAVDINQADQVTGDFAVDEPVSFVRAFFWENGTMTDIGLLPEAGQQGPYGPELTTARAKALNDHGQVVGNSEPHFPDPEFDTRPGPFFWENGEIFNLNDYVEYDPGEEIVILRVHDINNAGVILAIVSEGDAFLGRSVMLVPK